MLPALAVAKYVSIHTFERPLPSSKDVSQSLILASHRQRLHDYLHALVQHFAVKGITAMFTLETDDAITWPVQIRLGQHQLYGGQHILTAEQSNPQRR